MQSKKMKNKLRNDLKYILYKQLLPESHMRAKCSYGRKHMAKETIRSRYAAPETESVSACLLLPTF